jgi:hypothetical protein
MDNNPLTPDAESKVDHMNAETSSAPAGADKFDAASEYSPAYQDCIPVIFTAIFNLLYVL